MISTIARRLERARDERGFTLVEVIIAMTLFALIVAGALAGIATVMRITSDNTGRSAAVNLASSAIDSARVEAASNITGMSGSTTSTPVDGRSYKVVRTLAWQYTNGTSNQCSASSTGTAAQLLFLHIHITVTWNGMGSAAPVKQNTIFAPASKINDPTLGTVLVSVQSITGSGGVGNITATIAPATGAGYSSNTAVALAAQPPVTNADGCSIATKVTPGTYFVTLTPPGGQYRDENLVASPVKTIVVGAGQSSGASFNYDPAVDVKMNYATNATSTTMLPTNLTTSFVSSYGAVKLTGTPTDQWVTPISSGYVVYPGSFDSNVKNADGSTNTNSCLSTDPTMWPRAADGRVGKTPSPSVGIGNTTANVPMGLVTVTISKSDTILTATTATAANGDPGCVVGQTMNFTRAATNGSGGSVDVTLALPYGTWSVTSQKNAASNPVNVTPKTLLGVLLNTGSVTLDPRVAP
ncbi:type IV pilus modification PilV family protein [Curtobacterium sp. Leaf261]|uniref:type IV pilus modification PilV family protein n=1 Tax=Curtobacterium sp. Leaf261 TaxID=1736311 RepID=UPI0006FBE074|nr:type II secretion system protein [Curtobacterium sp. Leaf261]KQO63647.1 hypothetical protein ASF23_05300 [Curtobacterium sp. Leaf261]